MTSERRYLTLPAWRVTHLEIWGKRRAELIYGVTAGITASIRTRLGKRHSVALRPHSSPWTNPVGWEYCCEPSMHGPPARAETSDNTFLWETWALGTAASCCVTMMWPWGWELGPGKLPPGLGQPLCRILAQSWVLFPEISGPLSPYPEGPLWLLPCWDLS